GDQALEDFSWILKEIIEGGGDGSISDAVFLEGLTDDQVVGLFQAARNADYEKIVEDARSLGHALSGDSLGGNDGSSKLRSQFSRLKRRFEEIVAIDFFGAPEAGAAGGALADLEARLAGVGQRAKQTVPAVPELKGRTWVTRKGVYVDRIACAWLVRRLVDPSARIKFVSGKPYQGKSSEIRFDMFEAEYTHDGDRCSFEVMVDRLGLDDYGLSQVAQIIHDIDLKDRKFHRPEVEGIRLLFDGIAAASIGDDERLERGFVILDEMYASFSKQAQEKREGSHAHHRQTHAKEQRKNGERLPGDPRMDR
ncbi:MAG TPA: chromate resistance protein ChrB domain-containing protein, partial [Desulfatiglandales bacterium]|nr:chromate resistance protein ChrB domain-containing protein [Desulfatiglandales bacterium]